MHRRKLLAQIERYQEKYPQERAVVERFTEFVQQHPRCFERDCWQGHITGSAWLVDPGATRVLLTHHRKLQMWLQLGGHSDGDPDTANVALREAAEESGLPVTLLSQDILDLDVHPIPARKQDPEHFHFDVRFMVGANSDEYQVSEESLELAWVEIDQLERYTDEASILRMRDKWHALQS